MAKSTNKDKDKEKEVAPTPQLLSITVESDKPEKKKPLAAKVEVIETDQHLLNPFQPHAGEYHLVKLDMSGNEIEGSDVSIAPNTYERTYKKLTMGDSPTYKLKKKVV